MAIHQAPGVLAVKVDYETQFAVIGTGRNRPVPREQILESLKLIGYTGKFIDQPTRRKN